MNYQFADRMGGLKASAIREILKHTADPAVIPFAAGNPAPEAFPVEFVEKVTDSILTKNPIGALQYSISEGYTPLREKLKAQMETRYGCQTESDELIVTSGAQQAVELVCKVLCNPGDTVICEIPSFIGSLNAFRSFGVNLVGVDLQEDGICIEKLTQAMDENPNTRLLYLIPNFQNPSGITMGLEKRKQVYALCRERGILILEDNPYGELRFRGQNIPSIKSFDTDGIVLYCGSFSKILAPGLRVGFLCGPREVVGKVVVVKQVSDVHTNILAQMICDRFLSEMDFDGHIKRLSGIYRQKCDLMLSEMQTHLHPAIAHTRPEGGLFLWCTLPEGADMMEFCKKAVMNKVAVVPGSAFMPSEDWKTQSFRMNFSTPTDEQIIKGIGILGELSHEIL